jgi:hypothetical protein
MLPPILLPPVTILKNINFLYRPWWIIGFICGEASFTYGASNYTTKKSGIKIKYQLFFELAQKTKDIHILEAARSTQLFRVRYNLLRKQRYF